MKTYLGALLAAIAVTGLTGTAAHAQYAYDYDDGPRGRPYRGDDYPRRYDGYRGRIVDESGGRTPYGHDYSVTTVKPDGRTCRTFAEVVRTPYGPRRTESTRCFN